MCFSAPASFTIAAGLAVGGAMTLRRVDGWREVPLAAFPLLFAAQQISEGLLWLRLGDGGGGGGAQAALTHAFLAFALVLWPALVPVAALLAEPDRRRRRIMAVFVPWGLAVAGYLLAVMVASPYGAAVHDGHIRYANTDPPIAGIEYAYAVGVSLPLLLSSRRLVVVMGVLIALSLAATKIGFPQTYVSVWCFFAAVLSALVFLHFRRRGTE